MAGEKAIVQQDLSGGTNVVTNPYDLGQKQSILLTNVMLSEHGSLVTRDGTLILGTAPEPRPIIKLYDFVRQDTPPSPEVPPPVVGGPDGPPSGDGNQSPGGDTGEGGGAPSGDGSSDGGV
jgi:hypothetical protein